MNDIEMSALPFVTLALPGGGIISCTRDAEQLPNILIAIGWKGTVFSALRSFQVGKRLCPELFNNRLRGINCIPIITNTQDVYPRPIRGSDISGFDKLSELLSLEEIKFLKLTLNCVTYLASYDQRFGYVAMNRVLLKQLEVSL
ncbi:hypothetical protein GW864_04885 [bacterium]|nr:hypothetical protein [bacterium]